MQTQVWTYGDNRTTGVVNTLTEQVLTETTLFTFDHIGQRFQRTFVRTGDRTTATAVIQQGVNRFLQHTFFVAYDDVRRSQIQQTFQTVVTVNDATIQIVQVRSRKTAAIERNQRTQIWRQNRQNGQDHPFRLVARLNERFQQLNALGQLFTLGFGVGFVQLFTQLFAFLLQIHIAQQRLDRFRTHFRVEFVTELFQRIQVLLFSQNLVAFEVGHATFDNHVGFEVQYTFDIAQRHIQQQADTGRQRFQEPDVRRRACQLDVAHALTTHFSLGHFNAALLTDHTAVFQALVLTAQALIVFYWPENTSTEQTVTLRLERTVVNGFRLFNFTERP